MNALSSRSGFIPLSIGLILLAGRVISYVVSTLGHHDELFGPSNLIHSFFYNHLSLGRFYLQVGLYHTLGPRRATRHHNEFTQDARHGASYKILTECNVSSCLTRPGRVEDLIVSSPLSHFSL